MERLYLTLCADLTPDANNGPGWYVYAISDDKHLINPTWVPPEMAYEAARALQTALQQSEDELPQVTFMQLANSGTNLIRQATARALQYAEEQAAKVGMLRKRLAAMPQTNANA